MQPLRLPSFTNRPGFRMTLAFILSVTLLFVVLVLNLLPNERARALVEKNSGAGLFSEDGFYVYSPDFKMVFIPKKILETIVVKENLVHHASDNRFVREKGSFKSLPFTPAPYMAIPALGADPTQLSLFEESPHIVLRCLPTGAEIQVLDIPSEAWFLAMVHVPENWCPGQAELVASSPRNTISVGFGTPLAVNRLVWLLNGRLGAVVSTMVAVTLFALLILPFITLPGASVLTRLGLCALYPSLAGYLLFLLGWFEHGRLLLRCASLVFFLTPLAGAFWRKRKMGTPWQHELLGPFLLGGLALMLILLVPRLLFPVGGGIWFPGYAFFPASWSTDSLLSIMAAKSVFLLGRTHPEFLGTWSLADRGIVQAGQFLALLSLPAIGNCLLQTQLGVETLQAFGSFIQGLVIPFEVVLLIHLAKMRASAAAATLLLAATPFLMFNSFYIWAKLSSALLFIAALIALWRALRTGKSLALGYAILAFTLSMQNHPASLLAVPALAFYLVIALATRHHSFTEVTRILRKGWPVAIATMFIGFGMTAVVESMDPKSSWPITFLLTGEGVFGLDRQGIIHSVSTYFAKLGLAQWIALKSSQLLDLIWVQRPFFARSHGGYSFLDTLRAREMFSLLPAMGPGFGVLILGRFARLRAETMSASDEPGEDISVTLRVFGLSCLINLSFYILFFQVPMVAHQMPYGLIVGAMIGLILWARVSRYTLKAAVAFQVLNLLIVWYYGAALFWGSAHLAQVR